MKKNKITIVNILYFVPIIILLDALTTFYVIEKNLGEEANFVSSMLALKSLVILNVVFALSIILFIIYCKKNRLGLSQKVIGLTRKIRLTQLELCYFVLIGIGAARLFAVFNNLTLVVTRERNAINHISSWINASHSVAVYLVYFLILALTLSVFLLVINKIRNE